jgi:hypothetical protein
MKAMKYINSWNLFDFRPRTRWYQAMYVGLTWALLFWGCMILAIIASVQR